MDVSSLFSAATTPTSTLDVGALLQSQKEQDASLMELLNIAQSRRTKSIGDFQAQSSGGGGGNIVDTIKSAIAAVGSVAAAA